VRFAWAAFWLMGAGALSIGLFQLHQKRWALSAFYMMCLAIFAWYGAQLSPWSYGDLYRGFRPAPGNKMVLFVTDSGLQLKVPAETDQCWNVPLPCTPYPRQKLRLLKPGDFASGFSQNP
jgi:hypothetical protein